MTVHELLNEPINVTVNFAGRRIQPTTVRWGTATYPIKRINLVHRTKEGDVRVFFFSVSNTTSFMKLKFDTETLQWFIVEFYAE